NRQGADTLALVDPNDPTQGRIPVNGMKFENDFQATYTMIVTNGNSGPVQTYTNAATIRPNGRRENQTTDVALDYGAYDGGAKPDNDPMDWNGPRADTQDFTVNDLIANYAPRFLSDTLAPDPNNPNLIIPDTTNAGGKITAAIDNSNTAGITTTTADNTAAAAVTTGIEIAIDLAELGWDGSSPIKLTGWLNSSGHDAISNQVIGGIPAAPTGPTAGLGEPRNVDLSGIDGQQYVVLFTPGPTRCNAADVAQLGGTGGPDGINTVDDLIYFLTQFFAGNASVADIAMLGGGAGQDGIITADDLVFFLSQFFSPCNP
ncbi:MAG: GC-type dockerin domain-anchored protein, partial [Phycisphaerales bacterium]